VKLTFTNTLEDWTAAQAHELDHLPRYQDAVFAWKWGLAVGLGLLCTWAAATVSHSTSGGFVVGGLVSVWLYFWYPGHVRTRYLAAGRAPTHIFVRYKYGLGLSIPKRGIAPGEAAAFVSDVRAKIASAK
jgi:hypothetical protein